jgi:hypothetical protein
MNALIDKLFAVHDALTAAGLAHAFGGAIALAYCTEDPRGTQDLDVNVFVDASRAESVLGALPEGVAVAEEDVEVAIRDGQRRLWWDRHPVDVFLNNHPFHEYVADGIVWVPLAGREIPVLDCASLTVFKAVFNRSKDWVDIEAIAQATPEDIETASVTIADLMGEDDPACARLDALLEAQGFAKQR